MDAADVLDVLLAINSVLVVLIFALWCHITRHEFGNIANLSCEVASRIGGSVGGAPRLVRA